MRITTALFVVAGLAGSAFAQGSGLTGPSTTASSYMIPSSNTSGVQFISIATSLNTEFHNNLDSGLLNYRMAGIPDGLGIYRDADDIANNTFSVLMNHELGATSGVARAHGSTGAFVSQWRINRSNLSVAGGRDLSTSVMNFTGGAHVAGTTQFNRFCSADLAAQTAYKWTAPNGTVYGTDYRIFMNGEESGAEGRAFAHIVDGPEARTSWQLPDLARFSWENSVANPVSQRKTIVAGTDDSTPGQVYFYVGDKQSSGNTIERAGLMNGKTYGMAIPGIAVEGAAPINSSFTMVDKSATQRGTGAAFQASSQALGVTEFARPEDSAWNPSNPNEYYWVNTGATVAGVNVPTRLYRATFNDISNPELGGNITMLGQGNDQSSFGGGFTSPTGATTANNFDNIAISRFNQVLIQEDVGNNDRLGRLWLYDINLDSMSEVGISDTYFFGDTDPVTPGVQALLTRDEETSGIVDAWDIIGPGWWVLDMQAHYGIAGELVEGGQLMAVYIPQTVPAPAGVALFASVGALAARRRRR